MTSSPFDNINTKANISAGAPYVINISLTANSYHSAMQKQPSDNNSFRAGKKSGIWLTFLLALGLHAIILILPVSRQSSSVEDVRTQIEVELIKVTPPPQALPEPVEIPDVLPPVVEPVMPEAEIAAQGLNSDFDRLSHTEKKQLTNSILSAQFITEESLTEQIFGKQFNLEIADPQKEFHFPARQNMIAMLDRPMPEVPFAYTAGLVRFAYEPGVKGDLQRFWDVITPEFGWRTNNGTEFKCVWVLVVAACGWK